MTTSFNGINIPVRELSRYEYMAGSGTIRMECTVSCTDVSLNTYNLLAACWGIVNKTILYTGNTSIQTVGGTKADLYLDTSTTGTTKFTNCYIESMSAAERSGSQLGAWDYTVSFVKDTSL